MKLTTSEALVKYLIAQKIHNAPLIGVIMEFVLLKKILVLVVLVMHNVLIQEQRAIV